MKLLSALPRPFLVAVICETEVEAVAALLDCAVREGADAVELNLAQLEESTLPALRSIVARSPIPVYTACREAGFMRVYGIEIPLPVRTGIQRMEMQIDLLGASCGLDVELDPSAPPATVKWLIDKTHGRGCEAVISCHTGKALSAGQAMRLAAEMRDLGGDLIKIVQQHESEEHCPEVWSAAVEMRRTLERPFVLLSSGPGDTVLRWMACYLGSSYTFARPSGARYFFPGHPTILDMRRLYQLPISCRS